MPVGKDGQLFQLVQIPPKNVKDPSPKLIFDVVSSKENKDAKYTIGRHSQCDFKLESNHLPCFISRYHASITLTPKGHLILEDIGSRNGTFLNDILIKIKHPMFLKIGDVITLGCVAPESTISPGSCLIQENSPFKFMLSTSASDSNHQNISEINSPTVQRRGSMNTESCNDSGIILSPNRTSEMECSTMHNYDSSSDKSDMCTDNLHIPVTETNLLTYCKQKYNSEKLNYDNKENNSDEEEVKLLRTPLEKPKVSLKKRKSSLPSKKKSKRKSTEACSSHECVLPADQKKGGVVSWVQCDSCDKWYHTVCVGCNYKAIKKENQEFYCGLC